MRLSSRGSLGWMRQNIYIECNSQWNIKCVAIYCCDHLGLTSFTTYFSRFSTVFSFNEPCVETRVITNWTWTWLHWKKPSTAGEDHYCCWWFYIGLSQTTNAKMTQRQNVEKDKHNHRLKLCPVCVEETKQYLVLPLPYKIIPPPQKIKSFSPIINEPMKTKVIKW